MLKKKKSKRSSNPQQVQVNVDEPQAEKSYSLVLGGILIAMISIALLIFVLSEKVFMLS